MRRRLAQARRRSRSASICGLWRCFLRTTAGVTATATVRCVSAESSLTSNPSMLSNPDDCRDVWCWPRCYRPVACALLSTLYTTVLSSDCE